MGGRGGSSGLSSGNTSVKDIAKRLPDVKEFTLDKPPQLEGSEKQIAWAKQIRAQQVKELYMYAITFGANNNQASIDLVNAMNNGKDSMADYIYKQANQYQSYSAKTRKELAESYINKYKSMKDRVKVVNEIATNKSAKFWIDNRDSIDEFKKRINKKIIYGMVKIHAIFYF